MSYPKLIENSIEQLMKFPGVGRRSAERIVFWLLDQQKEAVQQLTETLTQLKNGLRFCNTCNNLSDTEICRICPDPRRDSSTICVVEDPKDVIAIEKTGSFHGQYHVLLGSISPTTGRGPEDIRVQHLIDRIKAGSVKEIVIATDADTEGEMTSLHLINELKPSGVKLTRIGLGIPVGSSLEYADLSTLSMSMTSRRQI